MVFTCLMLVSIVQHWIRDVQKRSSLSHLRPEMSKLKTAGTALNIAENAKISRLAVKMTERLWELNPECIHVLYLSRKAIFLRNRLTSITNSNLESIVALYTYFIRVYCLRFITVCEYYIWRLSQYIREVYGHKERKRHPRNVWKVEETVSKL